MQRFRDFLKRKDIEISLRRYGIDALGAMAQGLFCSLLIGTILNTLGQQFHIGFLNAIIFTLGKGDAAVGYTIGGCASLMVGPAMAVAIGYALHAPAMVLFSLVPVGYATNAMGGAGGPLAVLIIAIVAAELGKAVSKETKVDILVTPLVTILSGVVLAIGRIVGETAALLFTAGTVADMPKHFLLSSGRTLAVHMYQLSLEGLHYDQAYATGVVLLLLVLGLNSLSSLISRKIGGKAS